MTNPQMDNSEQVEYWNGKAGERWTEEANALDGMLSPFAEAVLDGLNTYSAKRILDVGCGAGALSLLAAQEMPAANITGVDVSKPMLGLARKRAEAMSAQAEFIEADASAYQSTEPYDALISRFGVMFFDQPGKAFANLHKQMSPGAQLSFACWRPAQENDWVMAPMRAALSLLQSQPPTPPADGPGPFAFADPAHVTQILKGAVWQNTQIMPWDGKITLPGATLPETADFMLGIGPLARLIAEQDIDRGAVLTKLEKILEQNQGADGKPELKAAAWIVTANA